MIMSNKPCIAPGIILMTLAAILLPAGTLFAADQNEQTISWFMLIVGMLGGLAFFLYGIEKMSEGMKRSAGNKMRSILATLTRNRFIALVVGAFVTMVIQSSSATTVMLVSFVQAELMTFVQSLGVILGANIGTTITAQMVAFKLTDYALLIHHEAATHLPGIYPDNGRFGKPAHGYSGRCGLYRPGAEFQCINRCGYRPGPAGFDHS